MFPFYNRLFFTAFVLSLKKALSLFSLSKRVATFTWFEAYEQVRRPHQKGEKFKAHREKNPSSQVADESARHYDAESHRQRFIT